MSKRSFEELRGLPETDHNGLLAIQDLLSPDEREPTPPSGPSGSKKPRNFIATVVRNSPMSRIGPEKMADTKHRPAKHVA